MPSPPSRAADLGGAVVGLISDGEASFLRLSVQAGTLVPHGAATVPWESGMSLGEPLERILGWTPREPVLLALETPDLVGETVPLPSAVPSTTRRADHRTVQLQALQNAREVVREHACRYFDCTLEGVEILGELMQGGADTEEPSAITILAALRSPGQEHRLAPLPPPDIPEVGMILLPLVAVNDTPVGVEAVGVITVERRVLTYAVWAGGLLIHLRSLPLGGNVLVEEIARALPCRLPEAENLLARLDRGTLSPAVVRLVARVLRRLLPLYSGAWSALAEDLPPAARPATVHVAGLFATVIARTFCRPPLISRCADVAQSAQPLRLPWSFTGDPRQALLASTLLRGRNEAVVPNRVPLSPLAARRIVPGYR